MAEWSDGSQAKSERCLPCKQGKHPQKTIQSSDHPIPLRSLRRTTRLDLGDFYIGEILAMPVHAAVALAAAHLEHAYLVALAMRNHFGLHGCTGNSRRADCHIIIALCNEQNLLERHDLANLCIEQRNGKSISFGDFLLKAGDVDDRKHLTGAV